MEWFRKLTCLAVMLGCSPVPLGASSPIAEVICAPTGDLHLRLQEQMRSRRAASGVRGPEQVMEVWTDQRDNWTLVVTYASGTSCIVAMGEHWANLQGRDPA